MEWLTLKACNGAVIRCLKLQISGGCGKLRETWFKKTKQNTLTHTQKKKKEEEEGAVSYNGSVHTETKSKVQKD